MILYLFILPFRPKSSAKLYASVWTKEGSPLLAITKRQRSALQQQLDADYGEAELPVVIGMRYGNPSIRSALKSLVDKNVHDITILPLYPQYCAATTGSTFDSIAKELQNYRWVPSIRFINGYHQTPEYINAISQSITGYIQQSGMPERFIFSYHGTPQRYLEQGDPYYCFCIQTTRLVVEALGLDSEQIISSFQSRFGKAAWLQPYTDVALKSIAEEGVKRVAVICPGFSSDCLETIEEIEVENRAYFIDAGGESYDYIPCLNDSQDHIDMMVQLIKKNSM